MYALTVPMLLAAHAMAGALTFSEPPVPMVTSTVYATSALTITHCSTSSSCQIPMTTVITVTTAFYTTVCPATEVQPTVSPTLGFSLASSSMALTVDATPYGEPSATSQIGSTTNPVSSLPVISSMSESSTMNPGLPSLPPAYSTLVLSVVPSSVTHSTSSSTPILVVPSTTAMSQITSVQLTTTISLTINPSIIIPPVYGTPSTLIPSISIAAIPSSSIFTTYPSVMPGSSSPTIPASVVSLVNSQAILSPPPYGLPSITSSPVDVVTTSISLSAGPSAPILSPPGYIVPSMASSPVDIATTSISLTAGSSVPVLSSLSFSAPSVAVSLQDTTETKTMMLSRTLTRTISSDNGIASITTDSLPAYGIPTLSVAGPSNVTNTTGTRASPSVFLGEAISSKFDHTAFAIVLMSVVLLLMV